MTIMKKKFGAIWKIQTIVKEWIFTLVTNSKRFLEMKKEKVYLPNPMRVGELIEILTKAKETYGNIPIALCTQKDEYDWERYELDDSEIQDEEFFFEDRKHELNHTNEKAIILFGHPRW